MTEGQPHVLVLRGGEDRIAFASFSGVAGMDPCNFIISFLTGRPRLAGSFLGVVGGLGLGISFGLVAGFNISISTHKVSGISLRVPELLLRFLLNFRSHTFFLN